MSSARKKTISFIVLGKAIPQGQPRACRIGRGIRMYTPKNTEQWRSDIRAVAQEAVRKRGWQITDNPVHLVLRFQFIRPPSYPKKNPKSEFPYKRPDLDNFIKAVKDALSGIVWTDDARIVSLSAAKEWGQVNQAKIIVEDQIIND